MGNNSVPKFICRLSRFPVYRGSVLDRFYCIYFSSLHVSSNLVLIIRIINCINTTSGICHSVSVTVSCAGRRHVRDCIDTVDSPDDEHEVARNMQRIEINT